MTVIVTDAGLAPDDWTTPMTPLDAADADATALDLHNGTGPDTLAGRLERVGMIRVDFAAVADGRGFTIAREVRLMGYTGRLRARGHVIADQYATARRAGFDEVEISDDLVRRQPEDQWRARANWQVHDHQARLRG